MNYNPSQRLKSRKPLWKLAQKLRKTITLTLKWIYKWRLDNPDKLKIIKQPIERNPRFQLPRKEWVTLYLRLSIGHGKMGNMLYK